ncbi:hypothetical protein SPRG_18888 [Saprolegnia parasitica CBS 223.65]|uniref:Uncharacterized protein n=1 Tax=Saprolegnia parasitica (strain CBS 223.65) TaxID=695850 RepID=A0A067D9S9_SAPPC|nr:hypothetical protein SPRG_18888 [Saprolegnia parasitica CBS 223.65]KDO35742.1 hypothetical protein SPRG_18888 [Saprolegnia parasitica CBS 223.65]|eukprot:XP_012194102.1 hypothetical protein SPRG_18888 [Saprolegnia parasitica CBS 223.65]
MLSMSNMAALPATIAPTSTPPRTAFVFGWDNFLCPSTWLHQTLAIHPNQLQHPVLRQQLAVLDTYIVALLTQARAMGPVFVVCDSTNDTQSMCQTYLPQCMGLFLSTDVRVIAGNDGHNALDVICANHLGISTSMFAPQSTLAVLGLPHLRETCFRMAYRDLVVNKVVCSARPSPTVDDACHQLQLMGSGLLGVVAHHTSALDMVL